MAAYMTPPAKEVEYGSMGFAAGSGGVTEYTFVVMDAEAGTATESTSGALNVGIVQETAAEGAQCTVKFLGISLLSCSAASNAITTGAGLDPTTGGIGIIAAADTNILNAVALEPLASGTGHILVRMGGVCYLAG